MIDLPTEFHINLLVSIFDIDDSLEIGSEPGELDLVHPTSENFLVHVVPMGHYLKIFQKRNKHFFGSSDKTIFSLKLLKAVSIIIFQTLLYEI